MPLSDTWIDVLAGWCSGGAAVVAIQPVDTVLTRLQAGQKQLVSARGLVEQVGVLSLWRGSSAMIGAVPLQNALLMGGYGMGKRWSSGMDSADTRSAIFVGGCVGGLLQSFLMSPIELIKVNQQVHTEQSALAAGKDVVRRTIIKQGAVWRGLNATILRDGIPHGVWFLSYDVCKNYLEAAAAISNDEEHAVQTPPQGKNWGIPLVSGAVAATVAWGVGYPFDLIKTRIQAAPQKISVWGTAQVLIQEANGNMIQGLYRGFGLKLVRSVPASMIGFTTYEWVKDSIEQW